MGRLSIAQVVGEATDEQWSQVVIFPRGIGHGEVEFDGGGLFWVTITINSDNGVAAGILGNRLIHEWEAKLTSEARFTFNEWTSLMRSACETVPSIQDLLAGWFQGNTLYLLGYGKAQVRLWRDKNTGDIFEGKSNEWQAIKGNYRVGDRLLLGTAGLVGEMSETLTEEVLTISELTQASEELTTQVHAAVENSGAAGLLIHVMATEVQVQVDVSPETTPPAGLALGIKHNSDAGVTLDKDKGTVVKTIDEESKTQEEQKENQEVTPAVYLKQPWKRRKTAISIAIILLGLLGLSIGFGWQKRENDRIEAQYQTVNNETAQLLNEAKAVVVTDSVKAKQLGQQAIDGVQAREGIFKGKKTYQEKWTALLAQTKTQAEAIIGEQSVGEVPVWFDFKLVRADMVGQQLAVYKTDLLVLDGKTGVVGEVDLKTKQAELVGGGDLIRGAKLLSASGSRVAVWSDAGVIEVNVAGKTSGYLVKPDSEWQRLVGLGIFGGNVYLLDAGTNEIWRYPSMTQGVGGKQRWLGAGITPNLAQAVDMTIDGDVWVGLKTGEVYRYRRGAKETFTMSGLNQPIQELAVIYTDENSEHVYLLDRSQKRVVVLNKTGEYVKQYTWSGMAGVSDMVVVESEGKIYLLSGSEIYAINL